MFRAVLLDIDDTLLDFNQSAILSMKRSFAELGLPFLDSYTAVFHEINNSLWHRIEAGNLTIEELLKIRWCLIFERLGIDADGVDFEKRFSKNLHFVAEPMDGALEILQYLSRKYTIGVASNSKLAQQVNRLKIAGLFPYIDHLFVSEEIGAQKPSPAFFSRCFELLSPISPKETLLIGDSLTADIRGGVDFGIPTCWLNFKNLPLPEGISPDYIIHSLYELRDIL